jgi:hypothetical protein
MKAKEKAQELVLKFAFKGAQHEGEAKTFALIAVDEILNSNPCCEDSDRGGNFQWATNEYYWEEVKQEIINL